MSYTAERSAAVAEAVRRRLEWHPFLARARTAGGAVELVQRERALIARAGGAEARVEVEQWWEPSITTQEDHVHALARYLAYELHLRGGGSSQLAQQRK
jgi:hypothetical protein